MAKNELTTTNATVNVPSFLMTSMGQHKQQLVDQEDVGIPRIKLMQPMSPEVAEHDATPGTFFNTVTGQCTPTLAVSNLGFERNYLVSGDPSKGGDRSMFLGAFQSEEAAHEAIAAAENGPLLGISVSHRHFLRLIDTGEVVAMDFANTAVNVSKLWNAGIMADSELPRCAKFWELSAVKQKNDKGFWFVPKVASKGYIDDEQLYHKLVAMEVSFQKQQTQAA